LRTILEHAFAIQPVLKTPARKDKVIRNTALQASSP